MVCIDSQFCQGEALYLVIFIHAKVFVEVAGCAYGGGGFQFHKLHFLLHFLGTYGL